MRNKLFWYLFVLIIPLFTSFCVEQNSRYKRHNEDIIRQLQDSLEQRIMPERKVEYNCKDVYVIKVNNQEQFDHMPSNLQKALQDGKRNIKVKIRKGTYFFKENYLTIRELNYPDADLRIEGNNATIVPSGYIIKEGEPIPCDVSGESCFLNLANKTPISPWGDMMFADELIEVVDLKSKLCRLKCDAIKDIILEEGNEAYIDLTRWCRCYQYKVLKIENGFIFFYADDLEKDKFFGSKEYNVNYDYVVGKTYPRFRLCNVKKGNGISVIDGKVSLDSNLESVFLAEASTFINVESSRLHNMTIKGLSFLGNKLTEEPLIKYKFVTASNIEFTKCEFIGQRGEIMFLNGTDNLHFHDNIVRDNYVWGIEINNLCSNAYVINNSFENNGTNLSYNRCVTCNGCDYYIAHNTFKNFGYCAISLGVWYGAEMYLPAGGIVEYNHIWYDDEHFNNAWKYTIMDSGAIYLWTQNRNAIVRYNYIHDYTGMGQNRGIYCDDGAKGVTMYGNIVVNVPNCHSLDSRRVERTESARNKVSKSQRNNINNVMMYNMTDGTINFVGNEIANNGCIKGKNLLLRENGSVRRTHNYEVLQKHIAIDVKDEDISFLSHDEIGVVVTRDVWDELKKVPCFDGMKKYVRINK